uniref:Caprin-1 dimerization domain-containing protein n=1 Tax=Setaria digitata TaxID=48799 RepID=A0A915PJI0_9BILA
MSSDSLNQIKIFKPFGEVEALLLRKKKDQKKRYAQLKRWRQELKARNGLVEHYVVTDYKLDEAKSQLDTLTELVDVFYYDMEKLKQAVVDQRKKDQKEFTKRMAEILCYKEIVSWLQNPEIREAFYDGTNGFGKLDEQEVRLLNSLHELINPRISSNAYEQIWKQVLFDAAKLGMEVAYDESETATVRPYTPKNDMELQTETLAMQDRSNLAENNWCQPHIPSATESKLQGIKSETENGEF